MWVVWRKLRGSVDFLVPSGWFMIEEDAADYADYLATLNVKNEVIYDEGFFIGGEETIVPKGH